MRRFRDSHVLSASLGGRESPLYNLRTLVKTSDILGNSEALQPLASNLNHQQRDRPRFYHDHVFLLLVLLLAVACLGAPAAALSCGSTLECKNGGVCVRNRTGDDFCNCPDPLSALEPQFFVGSECEVPAVMCADTSTFYCANGAQCIEIVQGEQYACDGCPQGYGGVHCDAHGVQCGDFGLLCFNGGSCSHSGTSCVCPREWSGNANCTISLFDAYNQQSSPYESRREEEDPSWYVPLLGAFGAIVMLSILGVWIYICYAHQSSNNFTNIRDQEEVRALQDDMEEREMDELESIAEEEIEHGDREGDGGGARRSSRGGSGSGRRERRRRRRHSRRLNDYGDGDDEDNDEEGSGDDGGGGGDDGDDDVGHGHGGFDAYRDRPEGYYNGDRGKGHADGTTRRVEDDEGEVEEDEEDLEEGETVPLR